jgi:hypothetical protein
MGAMVHGILPCSLPCRKACARHQARHDVRHGTRVIVGYRLLFDNVRQIRRCVYPWDAPVCRRHRSRFRGEADVIRLAKPAELVENDPQRTFSRCLLSSGSVSSCQQNLVVSQLQDWRVRHMGKLAVVATIKTVAGQAR